MRAGDLSSGPARLHEAYKKLKLQWEDTQSVWRDSVSEEFAEKYITALEPQIVAVLERMRNLSGMLTTAQHECER